MAARKSELIITCNAKGVENVMRILDERLKGIKQQLQTLNNYGSKHGWTDDMKKDFKELTEEAAGIDTIMKRNQQTMRKYGEVMKDLAGSKTKDLKKALREVKQQLENMSGNDPNRQKLVNDLKKIQAQIDANTGALKRNQSAWGTLGTTMKNLFAYAGIFAGFNLLKSKLTEAYEANKRFSDSMANVRKVSGLTMDEIGKLANNLSKIDSRTGLGGLMELSYTGAKLGYGNYGIEGLESFAKSAVKVQNALSEDMGADSMTALSKMVEVMGLIPKMGVERAMDATGSAIFKLASTSTATGTNIVEFSKRLMGLANIAHISTQDLLAFGSAADSMALMPEVAATAFNKLITAVQKQPNLIENALHIEKGTISDLYQTGHMTEALVTIFEKMREKGGMNALMQSGVFKDLGSDGARLVAVMATMANRVDMLNAHLAVSRQAFEEGTAVAQEYAIQMDTAAAYSERAANIWEKAFVNPEGVDTVKEFTKAWYEVSKSMTSNKVTMGEIKFLLAGIMELLKGIVSILPSIIAGLTTIGGYRLGAMIVTGLKPAWDAIRGMTLSVAALRTGFMALSTVARANIVGVAVTAVFVLLQAFGSLNKKLEETTGYMKGFKKDLGDLNVEYGKAESELRRYRRAIDEANTGSKQRLAAINTFNSKFKPYLSNLLTEKSTALDVAKAYNEVTKAIRAKLALQLKEKDIESQVAPREQWTAERRQEYEKRANEAGKGQYGSTWITGYAQDNRNKTIDTMVRDIGKQYYNLPQQIIDEVAIQAAAGNTNFNNYGNIINSRYLKEANALLAASSYLRQERSAENALRRVNKKWEPEQKLIDDLTAQQEETPYEPLQDAPDKAAERAAKKAAQDRKQALRKEMEDAQKASTGIISKLEEYYRLQEAAINDARADGQLTEEQAKEMVRALSIVKNESLATARRAVTTGETKDWDELKTKVLPAVMSDTSEVSRNLLSTIQQVAVDKLHADLEKFNGSSDVLGLDSRAFFDQMNAKAAGNTREAARLKAKLFTQAETMVKQYRIFDQAVDKMRDDVEQMGFITETYEEFAERMRLGIEKKPDNIIKLSSGQRQARQQMTDRFNVTQGIGAERPQDMGEWFKEFTDNGKEEWMRALPELQKWVMDTDKYKDQINNLYDLLKKVQRGESIQMTAEQLAPTNTQIDEAVSTRISDKEAYAAMGFKFLGQGTIPYRINIENEEEALEWMRQFGTTASGELEVWAQAIPELEKWVTLLQRKAELQKEGKDLTADELAELQKSIPQIQALYYKMNEFSDKVPESIKKQVDAMYSRKPIGIGEMEEQHTGKVNRMTQLYDNKINEARNSGNENAALELEEQKKQALIDLEYQYQQELYQIREQMGVTWQEQYEHELAGYKNMLDKKLISEKQFQQKKGQLQAKLGLQYAEYFNGQMKSLVDTMRDYEITSTENKYDAQINAAKAAGQDTTALEEQKEAAIFEIRKKYAGMELAIKISEIAVSTALGIMNAYATLPTPAAIAATVLIAALGAAQTALAIAEYNKVMGQSAGGSKSASSSASAPKTKLVSGMLTYEKGNVDRFAGRRKLYDDGETQVYGRRRYLGEDGKVYTATAEPAPKDGLVTHPIATTVQGQPALVAENGPEIVIGRETTKAIMMNEPELIKYLASYQQHGGRRLFDSGNAESVVSGSVADIAAATSSTDREALRQRLDKSDALMEQVLYFLQHPVRPKIDMYSHGGEDGLYDSMQKATKFMSRYGG